MSWFHKNRWLGMFLIVFALATLVTFYFWYAARSQADDAFARFSEAAAEKNRLERLDPFPSEANYRKMKVHLENYSVALDKLKEELKTRTLPVAPLAPNEFQSRLRQAMIAVGDKARANKVKIPDNFALGFDEYTAALPNTAITPLLGQELSEIELLMNVLIEARVDSVTKFTRAPLAQERGPAPTPAAVPGRKPAATPSSGPKSVEHSVVDFTFLSAPSAARKVLNQIASSNQQFYVVRLLHVRNEKDKGPAREQTTQTTAGTPQPTPAKPAPNTALSFIVGTEHIETSARVELVRFTF
jgi:hypothetical protein